MATLIGKTILSQFRVDAFIAAGGMGSVYRVWDLKRNVPLAMKVLHSELADDPSMFKKFQREARALQKLGHPNIVPFYGIYDSMDVIFMLERFVDGPSMKDLLKRYKGLVPMNDALVYLKALCSALGYAHANGVVHCDVKPGNVMVDSSGQIYLTDFGIARHAESATTTIDSAGTSAYMPPEQIRGEPVTPATDVYALGIILYEMIAGRRPFRGSASETVSAGESTPTVSARIRQEQLKSQAQDPREINPSISAALAEVTLRALNKKASQRYISAAQFFEAVCAAVNVAPESIPDRIKLPDTVRKEVEAEAASVAASAKTGKSMTPVFAAAGVLVVFVCVVAAVIIGAIFWNNSTGTSSVTVSDSSYKSSTPLPAVLVRTDTPRPIFTNTPDYAVQTAFAVATQAALKPTSTPLPPPTPTSPFCSNLRLTEKITSKGVILVVCYPKGEYETIPMERGDFAAGPNGQFFVYVTSSGKVYGVTVGEGNPIKTLDDLKKKKFIAIVNHDDAQYQITFSSGPPYTAYITETLYNQKAAVEIPSWLSNP